MTPKNKGSLLPLLVAVVILLSLTMYNLHLVNQLDHRHPCDICRAEGHTVFYVEDLGLDYGFSGENERNLFQEGEDAILFQNLPQM